jgi:hypothetical protein
MGRVYWLEVENTEHQGAVVIVNSALDTSVFVIRCSGSEGWSTTLHTPTLGVSDAFKLEQSCFIC